MSGESAALRRVLVSVLLRPSVSSNNAVHSDENHEDIDPFMKLHLLHKGTILPPNSGGHSLVNTTRTTKRRESATVWIRLSHRFSFEQQIR
jgi:hypothetical protein